MQLTSGLLLIIVFGLFLTLFVLIVARWAKIKNIFLRIISLFVLNLLLLVTSGLALNDMFSFYNSWKELFGITEVPSQPIHVQQLDLSKAKYTANGSAMLEEHFTGKVSNVTASVFLLLPKPVVDQIKSGKSVSRKYPVAMFMSGSPGVPTAWLNGLKLDQQIHDVQKMVPLKDFIAVLPDYNIEPHVDTGCMNVPGGVQVESWLTKDVPNFVNTYLPAKPNNWAITGYSTGGWCSAMLALRHPELFKAAAPIAGYYKADLFFKLTAAERKKLSVEYDLITAAKARPKALDLFLITSKLDSSSYGSTRTFYNNVGSNHNVELLILQSGGHNFTTWKPIIQDILKWFANELS